MLSSPVSAAVLFEIEPRQSSIRQLACQIGVCLYSMEVGLTPRRVNVPSKLEKLRNFDKEIRKKFRDF